MRVLFCLVSLLVAVADFAQGPSKPAGSARETMASLHELAPHSLSLSSDGRWVAFGRLADSDSSHLNMALMIYDVTRRAISQIGTYNYTSLNFGPRPVWSPSSELLAYYAAVDGTLELKVWDRKQGRHLAGGVPVDKGGAAELQMPQWTPDNRFVLCLSSSNPPKKLWEEQEGDNYTARLRAELVGQRPALAGITLLGTPELAPSLKSQYGADLTAQEVGPARNVDRQVVALDTATGAVQVLAQGAEFVQLQVSDNGKIALAGALDAHGDFVVYALPLPTTVPPQLAAENTSSTDATKAQPFGRDGVPLRVLFKSSDAESFQNFNLSPSGRYVAYLVDRTGDIVLIDLSTRSKRNLTTDVPELVPDAPDEQLQNIAGRFDLPLYHGKFGTGNGDAPVWTKDESALLVRRVAARLSVTAPQRSELWRVSRAGGMARRLTKDTALSIASWANCHDRSRVDCVVGPEGAVLALVRTQPAGLDGPASFAYARIDAASGVLRILRETSASVSAGEDFVTARLTEEVLSVEQSLVRPPELWQVSASAQSLNALNPGPLPQLGYAERLEWSTATGEHLFAALRLPADAREGEHLPVVLDVYPGRRGLASSAVFNPGRLGQLRTRGRFALLTPDMPVQFGSGHVCADFGRFATEALNAAIANGHVDGTRAGVMGISYGGYAVNCIITHTDQFRAAVSEAGPSDLASTHALGGRGEWNVTKSWPWETPDRLVAESPVYHLDKVKTPILFLTGKTDLNNSLQEYEMYFGLLALKRAAALTSYDNAGHGDYDRFPDFSTRVRMWFNTYLGQTENAH